MPRRKLLYRSKQRGWLEMDIMLGNWAAANLPRLQEAELQRTLQYRTMMVKRVSSVGGYDKKSCECEQPCGLSCSLVPPHATHAR